MREIHVTFIIVFSAGFIALLITNYRMGYLKEHPHKLTSQEHEYSLSYKETEQACIKIDKEFPGFNCGETLKKYDPPKKGYIGYKHDYLLILLTYLMSVGFMVIASRNGAKSDKIST